MKNVPLIVYKNGPQILAPDHCPYSELVDVNIDIVHPSMCPLCKLCNFISNTEDTSVPTLAEIDAFQTYLNYSNKQASSSLLAQIQYLSKNDRIPLAILISDELLNAMLRFTIGDDSRISVIKAFVLNKQHIICHIAGSPVYYSRKLTRSKIQVVGEVEWK